VNSLSTIDHYFIIFVVIL